MANPEARNNRRPNANHNAMPHRKEPALDLPECDKARADQKKLDGSETGKDRERKKKRLKVCSNEADVGWWDINPRQMMWIIADRKKRKRKEEERAEKKASEWKRIMRQRGADAAAQIVLSPKKQKRRDGKVDGKLPDVKDEDANENHNDNNTENLVFVAEIWDGADTDSDH